MLGVCTRRDAKKTCSNLNAPVNVVNVKVWKRAKEDVPGTRNDQRPSSASGTSGDDTLRDEQVSYQYCFV